MQYLHQSHYGHAGSMHTAKPVLAMRGAGIYDIKEGRIAENPIYRVNGGKVFKTEHHPDGASPHAMFEIRGDKVHTTPNHPAHDATQHAFDLRSHL